MTSANCNKVRFFGFRYLKMEARWFSGVSCCDCTSKCHSLVNPPLRHRACCRFFCLTRNIDCFYQKNLRRVFKNSRSWTLAGVIEAPHCKPVPRFESHTEQSIFLSTRVCYQAIVFVVLLFCLLQFLLCLWWWGVIKICKLNNILLSFACKSDLRDDRKNGCNKKIIASNRAVPLF